MGWKYTEEISRERAINLITQRLDNVEELSNSQLEDIVESIYGDNIDLSYYGANFSIVD